MPRIEQISDQNLGRCYRPCKDHVDLLATGEIGPWIIRFGFIGAEKEFASVDFSMEIPSPISTPGYANASRQDGIRPDDSANGPTSAGEGMIAPMGANLLTHLYGSVKVSL